MDWYDDENREILRKESRGKELKIAANVEQYTVGRFLSNIGAGQYSHYRLVDWMIDNVPEEVSRILGLG